MKLLTKSRFSLNRLKALIGILATILSFGSASEVIAVQSAATSPATSAEAAPEAYGDNWWRSVRKGMWEWEGADWDVVKGALEKIENATGKRRYGDKFDTIIEYGPGHWVYEWSNIGNEAYKAGLEYERKGNIVAARKSFLQASTYYTQASYPHLRDKYARAALAKAFEMYSLAGRYFAVPMEVWHLEVDGASFKAFVHFPTRHHSKTMPVILKTGGMDVLSTEFYPLSETINATGTAMIAYDSPGTGNDGVVDVNYDKHHVAVLKRVLGDKRFDNKRIGVWSESLAGLTTVRLALGKHRGDVAAVVNSCGPMHTLYALKLAGGIPPQYELHDMIEAYNNRRLSKREIDEFNRSMLTPSLQALLQDFQGETYIDRVRATPGDLLNLLSKSLPISLVEQGLLGKKNVTNTPILTINTHADPLVPHGESQLVTDASVQGKLMIYDNYEGHCVSRAEIPMIMEWLSYHLRLLTDVPGLLD
ncbi:alpha/beta hydrolase [Exilibacterium tricleocarpae]|uniref:Alpha/beta hydrolase n=1 Tax=Exilibacterium tricleocarpae TaxID=2591008 RepID=A0A545TLR9_9GAMM|nr:alpha/beta hydrolase [Exilibacterium tricleocarpae]TQV78169.1 alpha/beta hydrolase [Exilibacterium tricleocarpae]